MYERQLGGFTSATRAAVSAHEMNASDGAAGDAVPAERSRMEAADEAAGDAVPAQRSRVEAAFGATRRDARERAMELLYEAEVKSLTPAQVLDELPVDPDPYAAELVRGVASNRAEHDAVIRRFAKKEWSLERMPQIDRIVLRIGIEELAHHHEVPLAVVLDQAVELAKTFSTDDSGRFVNGVLAAVARALRPNP